MIADASQLPVGLHRDVAPSIYHARVPGLVSKSALDLVRRSPAHLKAWLDGHDEEPAPALLFGSAFHCALLEPKRFAVDYAVEPDFGDCRKTDNKKRRDEWRAAHVGATPLGAEDAETIVRMVSAVLRHPLAGKMIADGQPELTVRWKDEESGLSCKSRADYYVAKHRMVVDVKSAIDAGADSFRKSVANFGYHRQDALYRAGFAAVDAPIDHFLFVVVEKSPPHAVAVYALDSDAVARGHAQVRRDIDTVAQCVRDNIWPGYPCEIQTLRLPAWAA